MKVRGALVGLALCAASAHAVDITDCGQSVAAGDVGVLQADLDCSAEPPSAHVALGERATLDLNGHSILGSAGSNVVSCGPSRRCAVVGPGTLSGGDVGIYADARLTVRDVTIHGGDYGVVTGPRGRLELTNVSVDTSAIHCIEGRSILATNVSTTACGQVGIRALGRLRASGLVASDNGGAGVEVSRGFVIDGLVATNNGQTPLREGAGLLAFRAGRLSNATLTGNKYSNPFLEVDVDVFARLRVRAVNVTCDHSLRWISPEETGGTWGVCAGD